YARGTSEVNSVTELKKADGLAQSAFDVNFNLPTPPQAPTLSATALDGQVILTWENAPTSNNYLEAYEEFDPLALDPFAPVADRTYFFEGYEVIRYADATDQVGQVIAVYDQPNGVQRVIDLVPGENTLNQEVFNGQDLGVQTFHVEEQLTNYTTAYFGVRAIAYNELSLPKIFRSPVTRLEVVPARSDVDLAASAVEAAASGAEPDILAAGQGDGVVFADVVNPSEVTGSAYTIAFRDEVIGTTDDGAGKRAGVELDPNRELEIDELIPTVANANKLDDILGLTYSIARDGNVVFDPFAEAGAVAPFREGVVVLDGLSFSVTNPPFDIKGFAAIQNAAGPIEPWDMASYAFNGWGFPQLELNGLTPAGSYPSSDRPTRGVQQSLSDDVWGFHVGGGAGPYAVDGSGTSYLFRSFIGRSQASVQNGIGANDWEMRFTQECIDNVGSCQGWRRFNDDAVMNVPFELWNLGPDPADPSDDYRMLPAVLDLTVVAQSEITTLDAYDIGGDHPVSGGPNDPFTDWVYWFDPADTSPGTVGYDAFFGNTPGNASADLGPERMGRSVLVLWNGGVEGENDADFAGKLPEPGTTFRLVTNKPIVAGDVFMMSSAGFEPSAKSQATLAEELGEVSIVPNPYKGASNYERSQLVDEARITNLPPEATIRVFTLSGSLIRTIEKSSPERHLVWNMTTDNNLPIASGLYLIHVETDAGSTVVKFAVVRKRTELNNF
ncbi:MAG: T9SS type A sorting domain-containing protein, partial [Rhodothermaceae bacterium]|nr:T9SS type A sorting domain-containing protein [Rhodothermaceae bacterium]